VGSNDGTLQVLRNCTNWCMHVTKMIFYNSYMVNPDNHLVLRMTLLRLSFSCARISVGW